MAAKRRFKWVIEINVAKLWVEDGFDLTNENVSERVRVLLPYAAGHEITARVIRAPKKSDVKKAQGE